MGFADYTSASSQGRLPLCSSVMAFDSGVGHCYHRISGRRFSVLPRPRRLAWPRTSPFHGGNTGSNPVGDANKPFSVLISSNTVNSEGLEVFKKPDCFK